jgi:hypothetical protein
MTRALFVRIIAGEARPRPATGGADCAFDINAIPVMANMHVE